MGLLDWIGEGIGKAFNTLAEFIADGFGEILKLMGSKFKEIGKDNLTGIVTDLADGESTSQDDLGTIADAVTAPITEGWDTTMRKLDKSHSEISPEQANTEATDLWEKVKTELVASTLIATVVEALSFGQVEGCQNIMNVADTTRSMSSFAGKVSMMKLEAQLLVSYKRYLNRIYPNQIAGSGDLIRFALREVWDPVRRPELLEEQPPLEYYQNMLEQGYNPERSADWWAAHWVLPSVGQLNEMLHRRVIDSDTWDRFVKYNDFDPKVRPLLKAISYNPYTRVDTRRMWDLAQLSEQDVFDNYRDLGYDDVHAEKMTIWTKVYVLAVELRARYSKGWITAADVKSEIIAAGMAKSRADIWVQKIVKADQEERMAPERDLTKAEIVKGVKEGFLTMAEGVTLLIDMGYDEAEADYILLINVEVLSGSPKTMEEFQTIVNKRRKALGLPIRKQKPKAEKTGTGSDKTTEAPTSKKNKA